MLQRQRADQDLHRLREGRSVWPLINDLLSSSVYSHWSRKATSRLQRMTDGQICSMQVRCSSCASAQSADLGLAAQLRDAGDGGL